jgi:hypothetical protein
MSGKRRWRRSKKADREFERLEREIVEAEAKARSESEKRQERIKVLWQEFKQAGPNRIGELAAGNDLGAILVDLVGLQKVEIEHMRRFHQLCEWAKTHAREKLDAIEFAHFREFVESFPHHKLTPKQRSERERQGYNWRAGVGLIEYEFGGTREAELRKSTLTGLLGYAGLDPASQSMIAPTCLDEIFRGGGVNMWRLQELFGMHRNRFPRKLPNHSMGREILYRWRAIVMIMDALLSEKPEERKRARGAPRRIWLSDPNDPELRTRVLSGIAARINSLSVSGDIASRFLEIVRDHLADSAKK